MSMDFSLNKKVSSLRAFVDMVDTYLESCREANKSDYEVALHVQDTWGDRMTEWGWDTTEFLGQMMNIYRKNK